MEKEKLKDLMVDIVEAKKPASLEQLIYLMTEEYNFDGEEALNLALEMENSGIIRLAGPPEKVPSNINDYVFSKSSVWFWAILIIATLTMTTILTVTRENVILVYSRYVLGVMFLLFLPGYSLIKALFPGKDMVGLEGVILSIGISLSLLPVIGIILNYTPWGIGLMPVSVFLFIFTVSLALIGLFREYEQVISKVF